jgi:hypothetical protein
MTKLEEFSEVLATAVVFIFVVFSWVAGVVLAIGFWSTLIAVIFPPWAWYLFIEKLLSGLI